MRFKSKSCHRCNGDVYIDKDVYGWYSECIQCGNVGFLEEINDKGDLVPAKVIDISACPDNDIGNKEEQRETIIASL